jgi:hypothetical protein
MLATPPFPRRVLESNLTDEELAASMPRLLMDRTFDERMRFWGDIYTQDMQNSVALQMLLA